MDNQEIFDKVVRHLGKQKAKSHNSDGACMYRGANNTMCAVGCLIPDELYRPSLEFMTPEDRLFNEKVLAPLNIESEETIALLMDLQRIHDLEPVGLWAQLLVELGMEVGLETNAVSETF